MGKLQELKEELTTVFAGQGNKILDSLVPLVLFFLINLVSGLKFALWISIGSSFIFIAVRLILRDNLRYALTGLGGIGLVAGFVYLSGSQAGFIIPGLISGGITVLLCLVSVLVGKPLAAWSSHLTRRWPLQWYWHQQIRPAYSEVTLIWAVAFAARLGIEYMLLQSQSGATLGLIKIVLGWPFTILVLILSYLYGIWRLGNLQGPSVEEYTLGAEPPWIGQLRGF